VIWVDGGIIGESDLPGSVPRRTADSAQE
jgi:hypothetical protein